MKNGRGKRLLSLVLALFMLAALLPAAALAGEPIHVYYYSGTAYTDPVTELIPDDSGKITFAVSMGFPRAVPFSTINKIVLEYYGHGPGEQRSYPIFENGAPIAGAHYDADNDPFLMDITLSNVIEGDYYLYVETKAGDHYSSENKSQNKR